jgi:Flagellar hook-length control protein FliK
MNVQSVTLKSVAGALGHAARTLALEPGAELVARVVAAPAGGGRGTISLAGTLLQARLPAGVEAGQTLKLTVVRLDQTQLLVRIQRRSPAEQTTASTLGQAAGQLAVSGDGELLRAAMALAGQEPLWLPDGGAADVQVQADEGSAGGGRGAAGEAAFVLHSPELGAIEVRLRMADGGVRVGVVTAPGEATALAEGALPDLVERLGQATGRPAVAGVSQRAIGRRPPAPPAGRIDVQA